MSSEYITTDEAVDALDSLHRSVKDLDMIRRSIRSAANLVRPTKKDGKVNAPKTHETLSACLADLIEACAHLSQGDDADRIALSKELATRIIEEVAR
jgi:predicted RND superfamily exporter protein